MCSKSREEVTNSPAPVNLINDDFGIVFELPLCAINIKKKVYDVLESFLSFFLNMKK
jgi:hypothetical protein